MRKSRHKKFIKLSKNTYLLSGTARIQSQADRLAPEPVSSNIKIKNLFYHQDDSPARRQK